MIANFKKWVLNLQCKKSCKYKKKKGFPIAFFPCKKWKLSQPGNDESWCKASANSACSISTFQLFCFDCHSRVWPSKAREGRKTTCVANTDVSKKISKCQQLKDVELAEIFDTLFPLLLPTCSAAAGLLKGEKHNKSSHFFFPEKRECTVWISVHFDQTTFVEQNDGSSKTCLLKLGYWMIYGADFRKKTKTSRLDLQVSPNIADCKILRGEQAAVVKCQILF